MDKEGGPTTGEPVADSNTTPNEPNRDRPTKGGNVTKEATNLYGHSAVTLGITHDLILDRYRDRRIVHDSRMRELTNMAAKYEDQEKFFDFLLGVGSPMSDLIIELRKLKEDLEPK